MSHTARILMLYQRLMTGEVINKAQFALEFETTERSVDRDILAIRFFLSESFSGLELDYDKKAHGYRLRNLRIKQEIGLGECYLLSKLLLNSQAVRTDEQQQTVHNLLSQLSSTHRNRAVHALHRAPEPLYPQSRTSLKLVEDLLYSIEHRDRILLHFGAAFLDVLCVPYSVELCECKAYLVALALEEGRPALYSLDYIESYRPFRQPYSLSQTEETALQQLLAHICNEPRKGYASFIYFPKKESECES